jgi:hypothetical protein
MTLKEAALYAALTASAGGNIAQIAKSGDDVADLIQKERDEAKVELVYAEKASQIVAVTDKETGEVIRRDTLLIAPVLNNQRSIDPKDLAKLPAEGYATGTTIYTMRINISDAALGINDSTILIRSVMPPIGTSPVWKDLYNSVANEKIPAVCEVIGVDAAAAQGRFLVVDTLETAKKDSLVLRREWDTDKDRKPIRIAYDAKAVAEEIEAVK